jgi:two-component system cell cycle response regulator
MMEGPSGKILVAEDNVKLADLLGDRLEKEGYEVFRSGDGNDALDKIHTFLPDLVILDILMPGLDGYAVKEEMDKNPLTENIPVIFLTGKDDVSDKVKGLNLGAHDYITKPFRKEELLARVEAILKRKKYYEYMAMHDGLTGLFNLAYFEQQFAQFFNMAERYGNQFSLVVIDVNKFKQINDTHGHRNGDRVLRAIAGIMQKRMRKSDIISRYGGDEFAIILPYTNGERAATISAALAEEIASAPIDVNGDGTLSVTISYGAIEFSKDFESRDRMFEAADTMMYEFKKRKS